MKDYHVAIVGATGLVGREFARILVQRNFPMASVRLMASHRSAGRKLSVGEQEIEVEETTPDSFKDVDIALFSAGGDASRHFSPIVPAIGLRGESNEVDDRINDVTTRDYAFMVTLSINSLTSF